MVAAPKVSQKKLDANRQNARKSTGPRTAAGKTASSRNAITRGFYTDVPARLGDDAAAFRLMQRQLLISHNPIDATEHMLVEQIIHATWKLRRLQAAERLLLESAHQSLVHTIERRLEQMQIEYDEDDTFPERAEAAVAAARDLEPETGADVLELMSPTESMAAQFNTLQNLQHRAELSIQRWMRTLTSLRKERAKAPEAEPGPIAQQAMADAEEEICGNEPTGEENLNDETRNPNEARNPNDEIAETNPTEATAIAQIGGNEPTIAANPNDETRNPNEIRNPNDEKEDPAT